MLARILHLVAEELQEPFGPYRPRPSSAGPERCVRQLTYHALGIEPDPFRGRALITFDDGHWHEELMADWLGKTSYVLHSRQMLVETDIGPGSIDGIVTDLQGIDRVIDFKSINHFGFERLLKGEWIIDYFTQLTLYLKGLRNINPDITEGLLLFKNKNQGAFLDILVRYDEATDTLTLVEAEHSSGKRFHVEQSIPNITRDAVAKFKFVEHHRAAGTLPDRQYHDQNEFPCSYCRWGKACWSGWEAEHAALDADVELHDLADTVRYQKELGGQITAQQKERDQITTAIMDAMRGKGAKAGRAGEYVLELRLHKKQSLDKDKLPAKLLAEATETKTYEQLYIKRVKEAE